MQILIVEDDSLELFLALKVLGMEFKAEGFKKLSEALEWAKNNTFDILLSDYNLGEQLHAQDVLKALHDLKGKTFKSFVLTNYIGEKQASELREAGFDSIIEKPLTLDTFKKAVGMS